MFGSFLPSLGRQATKVYSGRGADIVMQSSERLGLPGKLVWGQMAFPSVWKLLGRWVPRFQGVVRSLALDTSGTWTPDILRNPLITQQLEFWRRGESNPRPKSAATRSLHA